MSTPKKNQGKKGEWVPGPKAVEDVKDRLAAIASLAFLGKRAFMDGDYTDEGWEKYLESIESPFTMDSLREIAFDTLLKIASGAWMELFSPKDAVEGEHIDMTQGAPEGFKLDPVTRENLIKDVEKLAGMSPELQLMAESICEDLGLPLPGAIQERIAREKAARGAQGGV